MNTITPIAFLRDVSVEALQKGAIFGATSAEAINYLLHAGRLVTLSAKEVLFEEGDTAGKFYIIAKGSVEFHKHFHGKQHLTRRIQFGQECGFVAMIALKDRTGTAIAAEDSLLIEISMELFSNLHEQFPSDFGIVTLNITRDLARSIEMIGNLLVDRSPESRDVMQLLTKTSA